MRRIDCPRCMKVKQEKLEWLADNPFYSKRFAFFVGRRCRVMTIKDVAQETHLDWKTVKELDKQYMREQLRRIGTPAPKVIGVDEIAIRKGHTLSHRSQRPFAPPPDLVWRPGPLANRAWMSSLSGWGQRKASRSGLRSWTCGKRFANPRSS